MYNSALRRCNHTREDILALKRLLLSSTCPDRSFGSEGCSLLARRSIPALSLGQCQPASRYSTIVEPSYKIQERRTKVGKLRSSQYKQLMKVLEAHRVQLQGAASNYQKNEVILTIPSTCNVITLPSTDFVHKITCERPDESCQPSPSDNFLHVSKSQPKRFSAGTKKLAAGTPDACIEPVEDLLCFGDTFASEFGLSVHHLDTEHLGAALLEEEKQEALEEKVVLPDLNIAQSKKRKTKKSGLKLSASQMEAVAKVKKEELEKMAKAAQLQAALRAYVDTCIQANLLDQAHSALHFHRYKSRHQNNGISVVDIHVFNSLMRGFALKGKLSRCLELLHTMEHDKVEPDLHTYRSLLEVHARQATISKQEVEKLVQALEGKGYTLEQLVTEGRFLGNQREKLLEAIHVAVPEFEPEPMKYPRDYVCSLLKRLEKQEKAHDAYSNSKGVMSMEELRRCASEQLAWEVEGQLTVKSVARETNPSEKVIFLRKQVEATEAAWKVKLRESFLQNMKALFSHSYMIRGMSLYPYLNVLEPDCYVNIMLQEMRALAMSSETFSPAIGVLHHGIGAKVMTRYMTAVKQNNGIAEKITALYERYLEYFTTPELRSRYTPREYWQTLKELNSSGPSLDGEVSPWPYYTLLGVGRFLYDVIIHEAKIDINVTRHSSSTKKMIPAFYNIYRTVGPRTKEEIKPHPLLAKLYRGALLEELSFDVGVVPMVCPPLPWSCVQSGVFLLTQTPFVRLPETAQQQKAILENTPPEQLYPSFDSLNILGMCPWKINKPMLDLVTEVFLNKGSNELDIPMPPSECNAAPKFHPGMSKTEKLKVARERMLVKRKKAEMYSLWCDALYKLSIANHFKERTFWFPHNMDFRGRVYPCPPHFNHLGSDVVRGILLFAEGEPLGKNGLDWLKIHLINLTGLKKRDPVEERLKFANEVMPLILDSADNPMNGQRWWTLSEKPWQTLACCREVANAARSDNPEAYVCHFPVHQDGSCNGLQHYAALGRDHDGAVQVNLHPCDFPQDVYSGVAALVERERTKDAAGGLEIARVLDGFIKRKVVKQTVMTVVYGVTRFGAHLQIMKQLKDIPDFPQEHCWSAAHYLVQKTFFSIQEMFTATREIQDWFTHCAKLISQVCGQPVEWVTPLGLPVVQPYHRSTTSKSPISFGDRIPQSYSTNFEMYQRPNIMKQKNAFPPNFIHSLDSTHMMLTSLYCQKAGITFVSVHDCFWTHPNTVDIMNKVCREQFVALHSEPILENLSAFLVKTFGYKDSELSRDGSLGDLAKIKLNRILTQIPQKGSFDLEKVLDSVYFFS
ncbi:DNA-directed RNA polymerase, mitochondrial-like [Ornithodoros turicata]|uniref:DNA-directed RNA polymerase, mitochondrial-like n=1 Tax=Ornithodoros turicata TaxID=34597 RepID=UPI003138C852